MVTNPWVKGHRHNRHSFCPSGNGCGYTLLGAESGTLSSQNYPGTYPSNIWCKWRLRVPEGRTLRLLFGDFDVESSPSCSNGSLVISDRKGEIKLGTLIRIDIGRCRTPNVSVISKLWFHIKSSPTDTEDNPCLVTDMEIVQCAVSGGALGCRYLTAYQNTGWLI